MERTVYTGSAERHMLGEVNELALFPTMRLYRSDILSARPRQPFQASNFYDDWLLYAQPGALFITLLQTKTS